MSWAFHMTDSDGCEQWIIWDGASLVAGKDKSKVYTWPSKHHAESYAQVRGWSSHWQPIELGRETLPEVPAVRTSSVRCGYCDEPLPYVVRSPALCWSCRQDPLKVVLFNRKHGVTA